MCLQSALTCAIITMQGRNAQKADTYERREDMSERMATDKQHDKDLELLAKYVKATAKTVDEAVQIILDHRTCARPPDEAKKKE